MFGPVNKAYLFEPKIKNRRLHPYEFEWELWQAKAFKRPPRTMLLDPPYYPWCVPEPLVNFDIVSKWNKGQH